MMLDWTCCQQVFELAAGQGGIDEDQRSFGGYAFEFLDRERFVNL
jgi:hypothetical protein